MKNKSKITKKKRTSAKKSEKFNLLFPIGYVLITSSMVLSSILFLERYTFLPNCLGILLIAIYDFIHLIRDRNKICITAFLLLTILSTIALYTTKMTAPLKFILLIFAIKYYTFPKCVKLDFWTRLSLTLIVVILSFTNFTAAVEVIRENHNLRYSFGFNHPNTFGIIISLLVIERLYLNYENKKLKKSHNIITILATLIVITINFVFTDSRASIILLIGILIAYSIPRNKLAKLLSNKKIQTFAKYSFILLPVFFYLVALIHNNSWRREITAPLNHILSGRLGITHYYYYNYDVSLFGLNLQAGLKVNPLDNIFTTLILRYGLIQYVIYTILAYYTFSKILRNKKFFLTSIMIFLTIYGLMETVTILTDYNVFILTFSFGLNVIIDRKIPCLTQKIKQLKRKEKA